MPELRKRRREMTRRNYFVKLGYCQICEGALSNADLQYNNITHENKWDCIDVLQTKLEHWKSITNTNAELNEAPLEKLK